MSKPAIEEMNIYAEKELAEPATANEFLAVQTEGKRPFEKYRLIQDRIFQSDFDTFAALEKQDEDKGDD